MRVNWHGIYPAVTTQYHEDQSLDLKATARHLETLIAGGIHGAIMLGTVGENASHEYHEKLEVVKMAVETIAGRVPVLTGVAENSTPLACRFASDVEKIGVDGLMVLPAMIYKTDPRETIAHYRGVARATALPIMVYNNPVAYGTDITPEMFADLADEETLVAIKESSENVRRITDLTNVTGDRYILFNGVDDLALEAVVLGAVGWVAGLGNAFPEETRLFWDLAVSGKYDEAREVYRWFTPLLHLDTKPKLVQYIKLAMAECGVGSETVRSPRLPIAGSEREEILGIIRRAMETRPALARLGTK
jgi:4-hydroxy-tetrahydrodipicolinate synthase